MAASFSIQAVAERTGLTPHVIRAWERRYRAIEPERSAGKQRLYSEAEIERLAMLQPGGAQRGHSIGKIAALSTEELRALVAESDRGRPRAAKSRRRTIRARRFATRRSLRPRCFDGPALDEALRRAVSRWEIKGCFGGRSRRSRRRSENAGGRANSPPRTNIFSPQA